MLKRYHSVKIFVFLLVFSMSFIEAQMPDGFAVWSEGNAQDRVIMMRTLKSDGTMGAPVQVCEKGDKGGDIASEISFDGKWVAFARSLGADNGHGGDDYHDWPKWDIYIARLDGTFPTTAIKVGHGYWPSWGEDSYKATKTLYFSTEGPKRTLSKVTIDDNGLVEGSAAVVAEPKISGFKGHMMMAPNGKFMACRAVQSVYLEFFEDWMGQKAGSTIEIAGGCHPSICADSRWVIHAQASVARVGQKGTKLAKGGAYHYGTSQDLNWFVTQIGGGARSQNNAYNILLHPVKIRGEEAKKSFDDPGDFSSSDFVPYGDGVVITTKGSSPDIHVTNGYPKVEEKDSSFFKLKNDVKGKVLKQGDMLIVEWETGGKDITGAVVSVSTDGQTWVEINPDGVIPPGAPDWGTVTWTVQEQAFADGFGFVPLIGDSVRIRVKDYLKPDIAVYSDFFTIQGGSPIKPVSRLPLTATNLNIELEPYELIINNEIGESAQVSVLDLFGKLVGEFQIHKGVNPHLKFDQKLPNGTYFISLKSSSHHYITGEVLRK